MPVYVSSPRDAGQRVFVRSPQSPSSDSAYCSPGVPVGVGNAVTSGAPMAEAVASPLSSAATPTTSPVRAKSTAMMFGSLPRSCWHARARSSRAACAFTIAAFDGFGAGSVSIQWLIWNSEPDVPPRFALHENSPGARNL